jgi:hypothetical protein
MYRPIRRPGHDFADKETEVWIAVVNTESADWFSPSSAAAVAHYCRHCVAARRIAAIARQALDKRVIY